MEFELYHSCVLVDDLAEATARYAETLGSEFLEPLSLVVAGQEIVLTFSRQGPPYLELIQANGSALYPRGVGGIHHLGYWTEDPVAAMAHLEASGGKPLVVERTAFGDFLLAYYDLADGVRVELVDPAMSKPYLEAWRQK